MPTDDAKRLRASGLRAVFEKVWFDCLTQSEESVSQFCVAL